MLPAEVEAHGDKASEVVGSGGAAGPWIAPLTGTYLALQSVPTRTRPVGMEISNPWAGDRQDASMTVQSEGVVFRLLGAVRAIVSTCN